MDTIHALLPHLPYWAQLTPQEQQLVQEQAVIRSFTENEILSSSDTVCLGMAYLLSGSIRVSILSEDGREITLFRIEAGECCVTTASCVIQEISFDTVVSAVQDTKLLVVPSSLFAKLAAENIYVRAFLYELQTRRFSQSMWVMQQILFKRFDQRLAEYFLTRWEQTGQTDFQMTQEEIAREVNSAREVVARMLRHFSADGLVSVKRGHILLTNPAGLRVITEK